jgi:hypothetical protein
MGGGGGSGAAGCLVEGLDSAEMLLGFHMGEELVLTDGGHGGLQCHPHHHHGQGGMMKFEEEFDAVGMFAGEDVFFGTA